MTSLAAFFQNGKLFYFTHMNETLNKLANSLFQKATLDDCSIEEIRNAADQYPYSSPFQLLLVEKLKATDGQLYNQQLQKLALHFNNPLWVDHLLHPEKGSGELFPVEEIILPGQEEIQPSVKEKEAEPLAIVPSESVEENAPVPAAIDTQESKKEEELVFQPYHTVDYFASQGIKTRQDEKPVDRFGQQLKSFTEWLRVMKKLPKTEIAKNIDVSSEEKVETLAESSVTDNEILTLAMAEVWVKQGNKEKAIEIYNKLSLLNPSKSHYFAGLIEQLKNS
jgi:hypothetical protein